MLKRLPSDQNRDRAARPRSPLPRRRPSHRFRLEAASCEPRVLLAILGQQVYPASNPINQNISSAPVLADSGAIDNYLVNFLNSPTNAGPYDAGVTFDSGTEYNVVHGNSVTWTPVQDWHEYGSDTNTTVMVPIPSNAVVDGETYGQPGSNYNVNNDNHMIIFDVDNDVEYELYHTARPTEAYNQNGTNYPADGQWHAANISIVNLKENDYEYGTTAGAIPYGPLLARPDEGLPAAQGGQGAIDHALYLELDSKYMTTPFWQYPALSNANVNNNKNPDAAPYGLRMRLKPGVDISGMSAQDQVVATALENYGAIIDDSYGTGTGLKLAAAAYSVDTNNDKTVSWNLNDFNLPITDFEWVDVSPKVTGLSTTTGQAGASVTITGQNFSYASPIDEVNGTAVNSPGLSVLFGGVAATNVRVVNDTTITATVPAAPPGYGTVDVQVVSGYNDPGLGQANIQYPVFGYGASAQYVPFTYTGGGATQGDLSAPPAVSTLTATPGDGSVTLNWSAASGATGYNVYRGTVGGYLSLLTSGVAPGYVDTSVTDGTTYYYQVVAVNAVGSSRISNDVAVMPDPTAAVLDPSFEADSVAQTSVNGNKSELTGFSSNDWEQVAYSAATGFSYFTDPNWGAAGNIAPAYEGSGNAHNPSADHSQTIAGVWNPTTDTWAVGGNPFPNGGYDGSQVAWVDALTSGTTRYNATAQETGNLIEAGATYGLTVAVGARSDTAFGGYQVELEYGSINPLTGVVTGTVLASSVSGTAPVAGGFGDVTLSYTAPASGAMIGQHLLVVLATDPANNAYNPHTGPSVNNAQNQPQTDFDNVRLTAQGALLDDFDVGAPAKAGSYSYSASTGTYTVKGGGADIWNAFDQFNYLTQTLTGDVTVVAKVASLTDTNTYAKAGLMIRDGSAANASYAMVFVTPNNGDNLQGANFEYRNGAGTAAAGAAYTSGITAPEWLKLVRQGNVFTAYYSADGTHWTQDGPTETIPMSATVLVGMAVDANSNTALNTATFTNVSFTGANPGGVHAAAVKAVSPAAPPGGGPVGSLSAEGLPTAAAPVGASTPVVPGGPLSAERTYAPGRAAGAGGTGTVPAKVRVASGPVRPRVAIGVDPETTT